MTHEILVGACKYQGDHVFVVHSPNLHDFSPNPSWTSHTLRVPMLAPTLYLLTWISKKIKMPCDTKIRITFICTIKETHDFDICKLPWEKNYMYMCLVYFLRQRLNTRLILEQKNGFFLK